MPQDINDNPNARERILSAAQAIFLQNGFDGASIRELTEAAGVNVALVNYYFGSKRNLYLEVLRRYFSVTAEQKCATLGQTIAEGKTQSLRLLISAYVRLYLGSDDSVETTQAFLCLMSRQFANDEDAIHLLLEELITPIHLLMKTSIAEICPHLEENRISLCIGSITGQIFHFLHFPYAFQAFLTLPPETSLRETAAEHIIEFSLRGIEEETLCDSIP